MMTRRPGIAYLIGLWLSVMPLAMAATPAAAPKQRVFPTAEQAVEALIAANRENRLGALSRILGPGGVKLIHSGDTVADRVHRARFVEAYDEAHRINFEGEGRAVLTVGVEDWPLPIPLVRAASGWRFDTLAGEQEILDRRIGRNELNVIEVCRAYVEAQREYAAMTVVPGGKPEYAQHLRSSPGKHDGLYWPTKDAEPQSPFGPLVAQARAGGYADGPAGGEGQPYHGYYFRILSHQGAHAPGGAKDFVTGGRMTGGFALIGYPAVYGDSGIMTFIVSQDGIVFEKNLGPETEAIARGIDEFEPDASWRVP